MKIIIVGAGTIGKSIIHELVNENHDIVCIDTNIEKINQLINSYDVQGIVGNGTDKSILAEANIKSCDILVSTTEYDETNILTCLIGKRLGAKHTIARIRSPHFNYERKLLEDLGINLLINPDRLIADEILRIIEIPEALEVDDFENKILLIDALIEENSKLAGKTLIEIKKEYETKCLFGAIKRNEQIIIPNGKTIIEKGDIVYLVGSRDDIFDFFDALEILNKKIKNILVVEGGNITNYLLDKLNKRKYKIKVINKDKNSCIKLSEKYSNCEVIYDDGTNQDVLIKHGIENSDCFISLASIDEENILSGIFAKSKNVKKIILKVLRSNLSNLIQTENFSSVISPKELAAEKIVSYVRSIDNPFGNQVERMYQIIDGNVEAIEFNISEDCKLIDKPIKEMKIKNDTLIVAIIRNEEAIIPNGETTIKALDKVIVISKDSLNDINEVIE